MKSKISLWTLALLLAFAQAQAEVCDDKFKLLTGKAHDAAATVRDRYTQYTSPGYQKFIGTIRDRVRKRLQIWHGHNYPIIAMDDATPVKAYLFATDTYSFNGVKKTVFARLDELKALDDPAQIKAGLKELATRYKAFPEEAGALRRMSAQFQRPDDFRGAIDDFVKSIEARPSPVMNIDEIRGEVDSLLKSVEAYPENYKHFIDETATMSAQVDALDDILKRGDLPRTHSIKVNLPVADVKPDGSVAITMREEYFGSDVQMKLRLKELQDQLANRTAKRFFNLNTQQNLAIQQAIALKKLETFRHELKRHASLNPGRDIPEDLKAQLSRLDGLYKDMNADKFKDQYRLPYWAWDRLRWIQLYGEVRSVVEKDLPKLKDFQQNNKIIQFLKDMPEEDRRALGISRLAESASIMSRTKWATVLLGTGTVTGTTGTVATQAYEMLVSDKRARELCAALPNDEDFMNCTQEYLQNKFPKKAIAEVLSKKSAFLNPDGAIKDGEVADLVKDILLRRQKFQASQNFKTNAREAMLKALEQIMSEHDMSSVAYRRKIVEASQDEVFILAITGSAEPKLKSFLEFRFPVHYRQNKDLVKRILELEHNSDDQNKAIEELRRKGAAGLADEVKSLLDDRQTFKESGAVVMRDGDLSEAEKKKQEEDEKKRQEPEKKR